MREHHNSHFPKKKSVIKCHNVVYFLRLIKVLLVIFSLRFSSIILYSAITIELILESIKLYTFKYVQLYLFFQKRTVIIQKL